eukprot:COSAG06_NODE_21651_length_749_cov_7921.733846_2_plen_58_part_01
MVPEGVDEGDEFEVEISVGAAAAEPDDDAADEPESAVEAVEEQEEETATNEFDDLASI